MTPTQVGRCPYCSAPQAAPSDAARLTCSHCGREFTLAQLTCPNCGAHNLPEADACQECGEPLSTVGRVLQRHTDARQPPRFLQQVRQQAGVIKRSEAEASRMRMESMEHQERQRQASLGADRARQTAFDRQIMLAGLAAVIGLAVLGAGWALLHWLLR